VARRIRDEDLQAIEDAVRHHPPGMTAQQIADALESAPPRRTLQYRLKSLVESKRLVMEREGRWAHYRVPQNATAAGVVVGKAEARSVEEALPPLSEQAAEIRKARPPATSGAQADWLQSCVSRFVPAQ